MTRMQRAAALALAAAILLAALILLRSGDDSPPVTRTPVPSATPSGQPAAVEGTTSPDATTAPRATATPDPGPLLVAGRVQRIQVSKGDRVRFRARASTSEELHVHGYDILRELPPGRTVSVSFPATIEGIFEIELERAGMQVAELRVDP
jgi:hypothetical protein